MQPADSAWPVPTAPPSLTESNVHIWRVFLERPPCELEELRRTLSGDELARADRYRIPAARNQYIVARSALRTILAGYLGDHPRALRFTHAALGKPYLYGTPMHFNLSHSHGLALIAVTRAGEIGIDVERVRSFANQRLLAERFFCPREVKTLLALSPDVLPVAFFHAWTRKEAFVKAHGTGIGYGVDRVEVTLLPGEPARLLRLDGCEQAANEWAMTHLSPAENYVAAIVHQSAPRPTVHWTWSICGSYRD